jgi:hypothetical protein
MKIRRNGCIAPPFFIATLDEGWWSASRSSHFYPRKRFYDTHWIPESVDRSSGTDDVEKKICPYQELNRTIQLDKVGFNAYLPFRLRGHMCSVLWHISLRQLNSFLSSVNCLVLIRLKAKAPWLWVYTRKRRASITQNTAQVNFSDMSLLYQYFSSSSL